MDTKLYLTIGAVAAILYALAFLLFPVNASLFFSDFAEARAVLYLRFCGAAILAWGLMVRAGFSRLVRRAQRPNCQRCRPCDQHHHNRLGNCDRLAQWACVGLDGCARFVVGWGSLPARPPRARR
jgi:hypothetical protein